MATKKRYIYNPGPYYGMFKHFIGATYNETNPAYDLVGKLGLESDWRQGDYRKFESWISEKLGPKPAGMVLNRKDKSIGFVKSNLEYATPKVRANSNTHFNRFEKFRNKNKTLATWAVELNIPYWTLRRRVAAGIPIREIAKEFK
jgi:hypothetical protein